MDEGTFAGWLRKEGERVDKGDKLFALESEKATEEIETFDAGILRIPADAPKAGDQVQVGQVLGYLTSAGEAPPEACGSTKADVRVLAAPESRISVPSVAARGSGEQIASPRARRVAREIGVDWRDLPGTGRDGRVRECDVRTAGENRQKGRLAPLTGLRRTIAARMIAGITQAAPVTLTTRANAGLMVRLHDEWKLAGESAPGYTDMILKLTAIALRQHPLLQAQWRENGLFMPEPVHMALAVDTEAGLLAPVVRDADSLSLEEIAVLTRKLIQRAREGKLTKDEMRGGTFTVTNLGSFHVDAFTPILQLPQCGVLGVGQISLEPVVAEDDRIMPGYRITLSLTFDHRVVDGAPAARFLDTVRGLIERPIALARTPSG
jgi:pyruvate dehydrogenase E2 component (dihydrolipoamide acetyltransferase)